MVRGLKLYGELEESAAQPQALAVNLLRNISLHALCASLNCKYLTGLHNRMLADGRV